MSTSIGGFHLYFDLSLKKQSVQQGFPGVSGKLGSLPDAPAKSILPNPVPKTETISGGLNHVKF